jgi:TorA maturation chaperone TorD
MNTAQPNMSISLVDELDHARADEYALLATLLWHSPDAQMIAGLAQLRGDASPLGIAHAALAKAARHTDAAAAGREFFKLFAGLAHVPAKWNPVRRQGHAPKEESTAFSVGMGSPSDPIPTENAVGQETLLPYASHYLAGTLYGRPLARLRETLQQLGIARADGKSEPEDHVAMLCEIMAGLIRAELPAPDHTERQFFADHLKPWIGRFFVDLANVKAAPFYACVGSLGRAFIDIETKAFSLLEAPPTAGAT